MADCLMTVFNMTKILTLLCRDKFKACVSSKYVDDCMHLRGNLYIIDRYVYNMYEVHLVLYIYKMLKIFVYL